MPNPFPGMNPYLESPRLWRDFHNSFLYCCRAALRAEFPAGYIARLDERIIIAPAGNNYYRDVAVLRTRSVANGHTSGGRRDFAEMGGVATLLAQFEQPHVFRVTTEPVREPFLTILAIRREYPL